MRGLIFSFILTLTLTRRTNKANDGGLLSKVKQSKRNGGDKKNKVKKLNEMR